MSSSVVVSELHSLSSPFIFQGMPFPELIRKAAFSGFEKAELQIQDLKRFPFDKVMDTCRQFSIGISSIATGLACREGLSLSSPDDTIRSKAIQRVEDQVELAKNIGENVKIQIGLLIGKKENIPGAAYYLNLFDSFKKICEKAEKEDIDICFEPVNHFDSDTVNTWEEVYSFIQTTGSRLKISMDLYHMRFEEQSILETIRKYGKHIGSVQLMDIIRMAPRENDAIICDVLKELAAIHYNGDYIFECLPLPSPNETAKQCVQFYRDVLEKG